MAGAPAVCDGAGQGKSDWRWSKRGGQGPTAFLDQQGQPVVSGNEGRGPLPRLQPPRSPQQLAEALGTFHGGNYHGYFSAMQLLQEGEPYPLGRVLLLAPPHAQPLSKGGFTKASLERRLFDLSHESIYRLREPARKLYADGKIQAKYEWLFELAEEEARQRTLPIIEVPELYSVVVAGSVRAKDMLLPFRGFPVTERITRTPDGRV